MAVVRDAVMTHLTDQSAAVHLDLYLTRKIDALVLVWLLLIVIVRLLLCHVISDKHRSLTFIWTTFNQDLVESFSERIFVISVDVKGWTGSFVFTSGRVGDDVMAYRWGFPVITITVSACDNACYLSDGFAFDRGSNVNFFSCQLNNATRRYKQSGNKKQNRPRQSAASNHSISNPYCLCLFGNQ